MLIWLCSHPLLLLHHIFINKMEFEWTVKCSSVIFIHLNSWYGNPNVGNKEMMCVCVCSIGLTPVCINEISAQFNTKLFEVFIFPDLGSFYLTSDGVDCAVHSFTVQSSIHTKVNRKEKKSTHSLHHRRRNKEPTKLFLNTEVIQKCHFHTRTRKIDHMTHIMT